MKAIAVFPLIVMASLPAAAADIAIALRQQGFVPGTKTPSEQGDWAYEVRGTAEEPDFVKTGCHPSEPHTLFEGKRFSYVADNRGEWGGELRVHDNKGRARPLIPENVVEMISRDSRLYVFTGLDDGMEHGAVYVIEDYDTKPRSRFITLLPGTPRAVTFDETRGGFLVVTRLSLTLVRTSNDSIDVLMARHASLPDANSILPVSRAEILVGICGGVAQIHLPWLSRPPDPDYNIPVVTYWTRQ